MLQKEFFQVQPFNPNPYWDPVIVNLSGAQKFEEDTVFVPGRYNVIVRGGGAFVRGEDNLLWASNAAAQITQTIFIGAPFKIRAYSGSKSFVIRNSQAQTVSSQIGTNIYSGQFKVNASTNGQNITSVSHIFGNAGSCGRVNAYVTYLVGGGNCLGNGAISEGVFSAAGAGSCLHILPVDGVFGSNYFFAFHTTGATTTGRAGVTGGGGGGSAYGGAASGRGSGNNYYSWDAGSTPYGTGGIGTNAYVGNDGTGIGHGKSDGTGAGAYFNGTTWVNSTELAQGYDLDGMIKVEYLGPLY